MDSSVEESGEKILHISEETRREHLLPLDEGGRCFKIMLKGINVGLFYAFRGVLYQAKGKRLTPLGPTDSWTYGDLILANHGGTWVLTAPQESHLLLSFGQLLPEECVRLDSAEKKLPREPIDQRKFLTRASLALIIGAGVAWGLNEWVDLDAVTAHIENQTMEMIRQVHRGVGL